MWWRPSKPRPDETLSTGWALVTAGVEHLRVVTHAGEVREARGPDNVSALLATLHGWAVYARSPWTQVARATGDAREWVMNTWKREAITACRHVPTTVTVRPMAGLLPTSEHDAVEAIAGWRDWLGEYGIPAGGLSTAATKLLTTTLGYEVRLDCPVNPREALRGGRMHAPVTGRLRDVRYQDIRAAYPAALAAMPVVTAWTRPSMGEDWLAEPDGFVHATVTLPDEESSWGCLPVTRDSGGTEWPTDGRTVESLWTLDDFRVGLETGARVDAVHDLVLPRSTRSIWDVWWERAMAGRTRMPDNPLVKSTISRLWGSFALAPAAGKLYPRDRWAHDHRQVDTHDPDAPVPRALARQAHVAALTAARVRARMYQEALGEHPCWYADTDGVITPMDVRLTPTGSEAGEWRTQATLEAVDIAGPQMIRYLTHGSHEWRYATSGVPPALAASVFRETETDAQPVVDKPVLDVRRGPPPNARAI